MQREQNRMVPTVVHIFSGDLWAGAEVMIFNLLSKLRDSEEMNIVAISLNEGTLATRLQDMGIETHIIPEKRSSIPGLALKASGLLKGKNVRVIHSHRYKENLIALLLYRLTGAKRLVTTLHGLTEPSAHKKGKKTYSSIKTRVDHFILKRYFDTVVAVSGSMRGTLVEEYGFSEKKVVQIFNGIPLPHTTKPRNDQNDSNFHIGTVGRMVPVKDFNLFLEIAAKIKEEVDNVRFSILGDGPLKEELIARARELKISESVEFVSPMVDPSPYYRSLDLYLNTSVFEGLPLSILEAMATTVVVVAPRVGGIPEIISHGENGFLIDRNNTNGFVLSCIKLIRENDLRRSLGENGATRVSSSFSSTQMAHSYKELYLQ